MLTRQIRIALLILAIIGFLAIHWEAISSAWRINIAYISLTRAIDKQDQNAADRFTDWAGKDEYSVRERDASAYGSAMLLAHQAAALPVDWLQGWNNLGCRLTTDPQRNEMIEWKVIASFAPADLLAMFDCMDDQTIAHFLMFAAEQRPKDGMVYIGEFERRGFVSILSPADRIRLAAVYGGLANQMRVYGSSTADVQALVGKSLALDPHSEMALINKALILRESGQFVDGIVLLEQVTALYPKSTFAWECLAALRMDNSDYEGAESAARTSIISIPIDRSSWGKNLLAIALLKQSRCTEALPYAQVGVSNNPQLPYDLLILGDVYWCLGEQVQASSVYLQLESIQPGYAPYVLERIQSTR